MARELEGKGEVGEENTWGRGTAAAKGVKIGKSINHRRLERWYGCRFLLASLAREALKVAASLNLGKGNWKNPSLTESGGQRWLRGLFDLRKKGNECCIVGFYTCPSWYRRKGKKPVYALSTKAARKSGPGESCGKKRNFSTSAM